MLSIIKLRLMNLRNEYIVLVIMTGMALFLTFIMGSIQHSDFRKTVFIVDEDNSEYSQMLIESLKENESFKYESGDYNEAVEKVDSGRVLTSILINKGFGDDINNSNTPTIKIIKLKDDMEINTLQGNIKNISGKMINNINLANTLTEYLVSDDISIDKENIFNKIINKAEIYWENEKSVTIEKSFIDTEGEYDNLKHTVIGFSLFFSMYTMVFSIGTILNDRKHRTWERILISPVSNGGLLGGTFIVSYLVGLFQLGILILCGKFLFKVDWGESILGILLIGSSFVFTVTCLGLFLSGLVKTQAQLSSITPVILTSTAMLGGCMWPLEIVNSKILLFLANITPQKWAIQGMEKIAMYGSDFSAAILPSSILLLMGVLYLGIGIKLVKFE